MWNYTPVEIYVLRICFGVRIIIIISAFNSLFSHIGVVVYTSNMMKLFRNAWFDNVTALQVASNTAVSRDGLRIMC